MKTAILLLMLWICGCGEPYKKEMVVIELGGRGDVDSITLIKDTLRIYRSHWIKNDYLINQK